MRTKFNKRELTFLAIGVLMLSIVVGYSAAAIGFLLKNLNAAFSRGPESAPPIIRFQIEAAEALKK